MFSSEITFFFQESINSNATRLTGDALNSFTIYCNRSDANAGLPITWIKTINQAGTYVITNDTEITLLNDNNELYFASLKIIDEEYYSCGYLRNNKFQLFNNYFLYIRG